MSDAVIQVQHVWKKFRKGELHDSLRDLIPALARRMVGKAPHRDELAEREFWALRDVSFHVDRGESIGIIGPNGAGKSTMLKVLSRILRPDRGQCHAHGRVSALIEVGAGFHQDLTGRENIYLNGTILGMSKKEIRAKEAEIIDFAGVSEFIDTPIKRFSSGMKARLGFAVAAHLKPDVLLVDEVLSVGDARFRLKCIQHMQKLIQSDVTVVFISHILDQVRALCPNTIVLDKGHTVFRGPTDQAVRIYLDLLSESSGAEGGGVEAEVRNIRFCDGDGGETLNWQVRRPGVIECELILHQPVAEPVVLINFATVGGVFLFTANTRLHGKPLPSQPGRYRLRFTLDPMPLADGDYALEFKVHDRSGSPRCLWSTTQARTLSVRGGSATGGVIDCQGQWQLLETSDEPPPTDARPPEAPPPDLTPESSAESSAELPAESSDSSADSAEDSSPRPPSARAEGLSGAGRRGG